MQDASGPLLHHLLAHRDWLRRLAGRLATDPHHADDLEQEVWLRTLQRPPREQRALRAWLATVLRNTARDASRKARRRMHHEAQAPPPAASRGPDQAAGEGEIAERQDVPLETVRTRVRRGLAQLRTRVHGDGRRAAMLPALLARPHTPAAPLGAPQTLLLGGLIVSAKSLLVAGIAAAVLLVALLVTDVMEENPPSTSLVSGSTEAPERERSATLRTNPAPRDPSGAQPEPDALAAASEVGAPPQPVPVPVGFKRAPGRVAGRVIGVRGALVGVQVTLERIASGASQPPPSPPTNTREDGWFRFEGALSGDYVVRVVAPGHAGTTRTVQAGGEPLEIALEVEGALAGVLLVGEAKERRKGVRIVARPADAPVAQNGLSTFTDSEGAFRFSGLRQGMYVLGCGEHWQSHPDGAGGADLVQIHAGPFSTGNREIVLHAELGASIAGRLVTHTGSVATGGFQVLARGGTGDAGRTYRAGALAAAEGATYLVRGLAPGRYAITVVPTPTSTEGPPPYAVTRVEGVAAGTENLTITLTRGEILRGRVVDEQDAPVPPTGFVYIYPADGSPSDADAVVRRPDEEGRFETPRLDPATPYRVLLSGFTGYMNTTSEGVRPGPQEILVRAQRAGTITGSVVDASGAPVPAGVAVHAVPSKAVTPGEPGWQGVAYTREGGTFTLSQLGPYAYGVVAGGGSSAYLSTTEATGVRAGDTGVRLVVKKGRPVRGRLVDAAGRPVQADLVTAGRIGHLAHICNQVDAEGRFLLPGVPEGTLHFSVRRGGKNIFLGPLTPSDGRVLITVTD
jgi:DNA-directed RNA polymerase specialized sigma24 family protein